MKPSDPPLLATSRLLATRRHDVFHQSTLIRPFTMSGYLARLATEAAVMQAALGIHVYHSSVRVSLVIVSTTRIAFYRVAMSCVRRALVSAPSENFAEASKSSKIQIKRPKFKACIQTTSI